MVKLFYRFSYNLIVVFLVTTSFAVTSSLADSSKHSINTIDIKNSTFSFYDGQSDPLTRSNPVAPPTSQREHVMEHVTKQIGLASQ